MKRIGVLISGGGTNLQALIDAQLRHDLGGQIVVVVSNRSTAYGLERARQAGIPAQFVSRRQAGSDEGFNAALIDVMTSYSVDLVVLAGFMCILQPEFIRAFPNRIINVHPALIPSFCGKGFYGLYVHQAALNYGVKVSGATVHFVDEEADNGPIILQDTVSVQPDDTPESLQQRVLAIEHRLLPQAVRLFCEGRIELVQTAGGRWQTKIKKKTRTKGSKEQLAS